MTKMLTAKELQHRLQVDRSTIYRMAEAQKIPAVKVGRQWRFPADQIERWLGHPVPAEPEPAPVAPDSAPAGAELVESLPLACIQLIQDTFAQTLGVMIVTTDMDGNPVTTVSNPCGLFTVVSQTPNPIRKCIENWAHLDTSPGLQPRFIFSRLGLLGTRGLIRIGPDLKGMVIAGGVAPDDWPPPSAQVADTAAAFSLPASALTPHLHEVYFLDSARQALVLSTIQYIADIFAQIITERAGLIDRLNAIAGLVNGNVATAMATQKITNKLTNGT